MLSRDIKSKDPCLYNRSKGARPLIELENTEHPLAIEQKLDMSIEKIKQIAELLCDDPAE